MILRIKDILLDNLSNVTKPNRFVCTALIVYRSAVIFLYTQFSILARTSFSRHVLSSILQFLISLISSVTLFRFVKLISSDGHEFIVKREDALTSGTIKAMLSGPGQFSENETNEVNFREIPSHVLQKVCMYFTYKVRYTNSSTEIPEFPIPPEIALELLMAANFLDC